MSQAPRNPWVPSQGIPPQAEALSQYLDALLRETWEFPAPAFEPVDLVSPMESSPTAETVAAVDLVAQTAASIAHAEVTASAEPPSNQVATWAAAPFTAQLFQVAGLTLALPVSELVGIVDSTELMSNDGATVPWRRGRLCYPHGEIQVVDTAHWVLPPGNPRPPATRPYPVLVIAGGRWGLAADGVGAVITLDPAAVHWRTLRTQRRWLAGMVSQPPCALLDPAQFAALLAEGLATGLTP